MMVSTSSPFLKKSRVGIERMPKRFAKAELPSTSTLPTLATPAISVATWSMMGEIILQGPHHVAQKSTSTGTGEPTTSASKFASVITNAIVVYLDDGTKPCVEYAFILLPPLPQNSRYLKIRSFLPQQRLPLRNHQQLRQNSRQTRHPLSPARRRDIRSFVSESGLSSIP